MFLYLPDTSTIVCNFELERLWRDKESSNELQLEIEIHKTHGEIERLFFSCFN